MSLRIVEGAGAPGPDAGPRIMVPGAPPSRGPAPNELAQHLRHGEVLAWWGLKGEVAYGPVAVTFAATLAVLGLVSLFAPGFWSMPFRELLKPLAALASPTVFVLVRELMSRGAVLVTDEAIVGVRPGGAASRLSLTAVRSIRRDWLRGGVWLRGPHSDVYVPPILGQDARDAVRSRLRSVITGSTSVDDPTGFWP